MENSVLEYHSLGIGRLYHMHVGVKGLVEVEASRKNRKPNTSLMLSAGPLPLLVSLSLSLLLFHASHPYSLLCNFLILYY